MPATETSEAEIQAALNGLGIETIYGPRSRVDLVAMIEALAEETERGKDNRVRELVAENYDLNGEIEDLRATNIDFWEKIQALEVELGRLKDYCAALEERLGKTA